MLQDNLQSEGIWSAPRWFHPCLSAPRTDAWQEAIMSLELITDPLNAHLCESRIRKMSQTAIKVLYEAPQWQRSWREAADEVLFNENKDDGGEICLMCFLLGLSDISVEKILVLQYNFNLAALDAVRQR